MNRFAKRVRNIEISGIRRMFELARKMKDPFDFSLGLPDFDIPSEVKAAMHEAIDTGHNRYTPTQGTGEAQDAVTAYLNRTYGIEAGRENTLVTSGSTGGIYTAFMALVDEEDEVLVPDPYFTLYPCHLGFCRAQPVFLDTYESGFKLTPALLKKSITPKTRTLIFNNPCNPTGVAYTADEIRDLASVCREHDLTVISDEVYDRFSYDFAHEPFYRHHSKTILIGALSKTHAMTGWRLGYAVGPQEIIEKMMVVQQFTYVCAPSVAQEAAIHALRLGPDPKVAEDYGRKRDKVVKILRGAFEFEAPQGAFYIFPRAPNDDADALVQKALEQQIIIVPGKTSSRRNSNFRISFAVPDDKLETGLRKLAGLAS